MINGIDAVITWVDMTDSDWLDMYSEHFDNKPDRNRYKNHNELLYGLRSIEKHATFIKNIYIVTNCKPPSWLNLNHPKIKMISHVDIYEDENVLPVFNSHAIEVNIHRIPGLSRHFIYLNDDFFFNNPV